MGMYNKTNLIMLETDLTQYQLFDSLQQREFLQRVINLLNSSKRAYFEFEELINKEEEHCQIHGIKLPQNYPNHES